MNEGRMKRCSRCNNGKLMTNFHKNSKSNDASFNQCKSCRKQYYK